MAGRLLYLSERASGPSDSPLDVFVPAGDHPIPYMSKIDRDLYVGGVNPTLLLPPWIEYVVSLHPVEYRQVHELEGFAQFKVADSEKQDPRVFLLASDVASGFWEKGPTLIHCALGMNRACTVAALALMDVKGMSSHTAIETLRSNRHPNVLFNKVFVDFLHAQDIPPAAPNFKTADDYAEPAFTGKNPEDSDIFDGPIEGFDDEGQKTRIWHRRSA